MLVAEDHGCGHCNGARGASEAWGPTASDDWGQRGAGAPQAATAGMPGFPAASPPEPRGIASLIAPRVELPGGEDDQTALLPSGPEFLHQEALIGDSAAPGELPVGTANLSPACLPGGLTSDLGWSPCGTSFGGGGGVAAPATAPGQDLVMMMEMMSAGEQHGSGSGCAGLDDDVGAWARPSAMADGQGGGAAGAIRVEKQGSHAASWAVAAASGAGAAAVGTGRRGERGGVQPASPGTSHGSGSPDAAAATSSDGVASNGHGAAAAALLGTAAAPAGAGRGDDALAGRPAAGSSGGEGADATNQPPQQLQPAPTRALSQATDFDAARFNLSAEQEWQLRLTTSLAFFKPCGACSGAAGQAEGGRQHVSQGACCTAWGRRVGETRLRQRCMHAAASWHHSCSLFTPCISSHDEHLPAPAALLQACMHAPFTDMALPLAAAYKYVSCPPHPHPPPPLCLPASNCSCP